MGIATTETFSRAIGTGLSNSVGIENRVKLAFTHIPQFRLSARIMRSNNYDTYKLGQSPACHTFRQF